MTLEGFGPQVGDAVTLQVLRPGEGFPTTLLGADETTIVIVFSKESGGQAVAFLNQNVEEFRAASLPFVPEQFGHTSKGPATSIPVTDEGTLSCKHNSKIGSAHTKKLKRSGRATVDAHRRKKKKKLL